MIRPVNYNRIYEILLKTALRTDSLRLSPLTTIFQWNLLTTTRAYEYRNITLTLDRSYLEVWLLKKTTQFSYAYPTIITLIKHILDY